MKLKTFLFTLMITFLFACSNNTNIAGKYDVEIDIDEFTSSLGMIEKFAAKKALSMIDIKMNFSKDGKFTVSGGEYLLGDMFSGKVATYTVEGEKIILKAAKGDLDPVTFIATPTEEGYTLKSEDVTFILKREK